MKQKMTMIALILFVLIIFTACAPSVIEEQSPEPAVESAEPVAQAMDEDDFLPIVLPVYEDLENYLGTQVSVSGFAFYRDSFGENEFMVTRMMVECCFDDASPTGFVTLWTQSVLPEANEWIRVTGIIDQREATDSVTGMTFIQPYLIAESVESIEPYESEYVFYEAE